MKNAIFIEFVAFKSRLVAGRGRFIGFWLRILTSPRTAWLTRVVGKITYVQALGALGARRYGMLLTDGRGKNRLRLTKISFFIYRQWSFRFAVPF